MSQAPHNAGNNPIQDGPQPPPPDPPGPIPGPPPPGPVPPSPDAPFTPPVPFPHDWWRCWRRQGVSGRYSGAQAQTNFFGSSMELRVDVDTRYSTSSPVMDRLSGDMYVTQVVNSGGRR